MRIVGEYPKLEILHRRRSPFLQTLHESLINFVMAHYVTTVQSISNNIPLSLETGTVAELFLYSKDSLYIFILKRAADIIRMTYIHCEHKV